MSSTTTTNATTASSLSVFFIHLFRMRTFGDKWHRLVLTGKMPFLSPNQQCQSTEENSKSPTRLMLSSTTTDCQPSDGGTLNTNHQQFQMHCTHTHINTKALQCSALSQTKYTRVHNVISSCAQALHALRVLRAHSIDDASLQTTYWSVIIVKLTYTSSAWRGTPVQLIDNLSLKHSSTRTCQPLPSCAW